MKKLLIIIMVMALIPLVTGYSNDTFNNSLTSEILNFTTSGDILRYLSVPSGSYLSTAFLKELMP